LIPRLLATLVGAMGFVGALFHPFGPVESGSAYLIAFAFFARYSGAWLVVLPLLYSVGDLYPWTGRMLVTEADLGCAAMAAVLLWRCGIPVVCREKKWNNFWLWGPLVFSCAVALAIGWHRLPVPLTGDELSIYGSQSNALRIAKGYLWGFFFAPFVLSESRALPSRNNLLLSGFRLAAAIVGSVMVWERYVTVGLLNADDPYRATGPIFSCHVGGMQVDAYWALLLPILMIPPSRTKSPVSWISYPAVLLIAYLAIAATMSRGAILVAIGQSILALGILVFEPLFDPAKPNRRLFASMGAAAGILVGVLAMFVSSEAMWSRMETMGKDFGNRRSHWQRLCGATQKTAFETMLGDGLGVVPNLIATTYGLPARPAELKQGLAGEAFLQMYPGRAVFVEQLISAKHPGPWHMKVRARSTGSVRVYYHLCRKTLYRSFECVEGVLSDFDPAMTNSASVVLDIECLQLIKSNLSAPPITFALSAGGENAPVDIYSIELKDTEGQDLLRNGKFDRGTSFWFFTSDELSTWHSDNVWVQLYLEQGVVGVICFAWLMFGTLWLLVRSMRASFSFAKVGLAMSILGFLTIGVIGSLVDTPNMTSLLLLCAAMCQAESIPGDRENKR